MQFKQKIYISFTKCLEPEFKLHKIYEYCNTWRQFME